MLKTKTGIQKNSFLKFATRSGVAALLSVVMLTPAQAQIFDWDESGNGSDYADNQDVGLSSSPGGVNQGTISGIQDISDQYAVDIDWTEIGTITEPDNYGEDLVTWQIPTGTAPATGAFGGNAVDAYIAVGWDNDLDNPNDGASATFTFNDTLYGVNFSIYDLDEDETADPTPGPWDDIVQVTLNGSTLATSNAAFYTLGACVSIANDAIFGSGNAFEGVGSAAGSDSDPAPTCATRGENTPGTSADGNVDFDFGSTGVTSFTIDYRSGNNIGAETTTGTNPAAQRIGITNITFPLVNGHIYEDINANGTQDSGEPDLSGIEVYLCSAGVSGDCDQGDAEYLRTVVTDINGDWVGNTTEGAVVASINAASLPTGLSLFNQTEGSATSSSSATVGTNTFSENDGFTRVVTSCPILPSERTYNFDDLTASGIPSPVDNDAAFIQFSNQYAAQGMIVSATGGLGIASVYNTNSGAGGDDPDLEFSNTNNAIIVQEAIATGGDDANGINDPDDVAGGSLILTFTQPVLDFRVRLVDYENAGGVDGQLIFTDSNNNTATVTHTQLAQNPANSVLDPDIAFGQSPLTNADCDPIGDEANCTFINSITAVELGLQDIVSVEYDMSASGGLDDIRVSTCYLGVIGDRVFLDINGNGDFDPGEGINGATVQLTPESTVDLGAGNGVAITTTTSSDGLYIFDELPAGTYNVSVIAGLPSGTTNTVDPDGTPDSSSTFYLGTNESNLDQDFGYAPGSGVADIGDLIFYDLNGDGIFNGADSGIAGVEVELCRPNVPVSTTFASDDWSSASYSAGTGFASGSSWVETGDDGSSSTTTGDFYISGAGPTAQLVIDPGAGDSAILTRGLDLSNFVGDITVEIDYLANSALYEASDQVLIQVDADGAGAGGFVTEFSFLGDGATPGTDIIVIPDNTALSGTASFTFTPSSADAIIRFNAIQLGFGTEQLNFSEIRITGTQLQTVCETDTTDANGNYLFEDQPAGVYTVTVDPNGTTLPLTQINPVPTADPEGAPDGSSTFSFAGSADNLDQDFGYQPNQITGNVSLDVDGDVFGDSAIPNATVLLYTDPNGDGDPSDGELVASTLTDASGNFAFTGRPLGSGTTTAEGTGVPVGNYVVVEVDPAGLKSVDDGDTSADAGGDAANRTEPVGSVDNYIPVGLGSGEIDADNNFVDAQPASIEGTVWFDEDLDGILDIEESGITGVTVQLVDTNTSTVIATTVTDANGDYLFEDVPAGSYEVNVIDGSGTPLADLQNTAGVGGIDPKPVTVAAGDEIKDIDFGYIPQTNEGAIGDRVWADANGDGIQDPGEAGIANVSLSLTGTDANGSPVNLTTTTNSNGDYLFTGVPFGSDYIVTITGSTIDAALLVSGGTLDGYTATTGPQSEGGLVGNPVTLEATLPVVTDIDFGFDLAALNTVRDTVWNDVDGDGIKDPGEAGIPNVTINIVDDATGEIIASATTDANGDVAFSGLPDGSYRLEITDNNDELAAYNGTTVEGVNRVSDPVSVAGGADVNDDSFGYNNPGSISGTVYFDADDFATANNDQDPGELGIAGTTVTLLQDTDGNGSFETTVSTIVTDATGFYEFDGLPPGSYQVVVSQPSGSQQTEDPEGVADRDNTTEVLLAVGGSDVGNDFGYADLPDVYDLSGTVFLDPDKDGVEDAGEPGIPNVTLDLRLPELDIIDGGLDINGDGVIDANDDGDYLGVEVINGLLDVNGDSTISALDAGSLNGVDVIDGRLDVNNDGDVTTNPGLDDGTFPVTILATTTTDANGDYIFKGLPDGPYEVAVTDTNAVLGGYDITSGLDVLSRTIDGADEVDVDFGYIKEEATGSIAGVVWVDDVPEGATNGNGIPDQDEFKLANVDVHLCTAPPVPLANECDPLDSNYIGTTTTDINGEYIFRNLPPGQYFTDTDPSDIPAGLDKTVDPGTVELSEGEDVTDVNHGYEPAANSGVLSGFIWTDVDGDGLFDPNEAPIGGVRIEVRDRDQATTTEPNGPVIAFTDTAPDGSWIISNIVAPELKDNLLVQYQITNPTSMQTIDDLAGADLIEGQPTNMPIGTFEYFDVDLASDPDNNISFLDFGFEPQVVGSLGSIAGTIYSDADQNGDYLAATDGELQDVTISLLNENGDVIATTRTDANGDYMFVGLPFGTVADPAEYTVVVTDNQNVTKDLNVNETITNPVELTDVTPNVTEVDQGYISDTDLFSIGNTFFFDSDNDGFQDDNEPGIPDITIQCWLDADQSERADGDLNNPAALSSDVVPVPGTDNLIRTVKTDENGEYYCTSLPAGDYIVVVADSGPYNETDDASTPTTPNAADGFAKNWRYALSLSDTGPNYTADFAVAGNNTLSGFIAVEDPGLADPSGTSITPTELDGIPSADTSLTNISPDTPPAAPVTVVLEVADINGNFSTLSSTTTDGTGFYEFENLPDGDYRVVVQTNGSSIDGFGQTSDPDLPDGAPSPTDFDARLCDSDTAALCDNRSPAYSLSGGADQTSVNFTYQRDFTTTPVTMNYFSSVRSGSVVTFNWETSNEVAHAGFQIYARVSDGWELLTPELIIDLSQNEMATTQYTFSAATDAKWVALVDVSNNEVVTPHGPYRVGLEYGATMETPIEFDWSTVDLSKGASADTVQESAQPRIDSILNSNEFDYVDDTFEEDDDDETEAQE